MAVRHTIKGRIGSYTGRTIIDEFGAPMTTGINYLANHNGAHYQSYFAAVTDLARSDGIGTVYWAGLKTGDSFSMEAHHRSGLVDNNSPGATQLRWGYGGLSGPQVPGMPDRRLFPGPAGDAGKYGVCPSDAGHRTSDCGGRRYDGTRPGEWRRCRRRPLWITSTPASAGDGHGTPAPVNARAIRVGNAAQDCPAGARPGGLLG